MAPAQGAALRSEPARLLESGLLEQPCREHRFIVRRCILEQLLARLAAGSKISEHLGDHLSEPRLIENRPRHGSFFEDGCAYGLCLLLLALQLETVGLLLPLFPGRC